MTESDIDKLKAELALARLAGDAAVKVVAALDYEHLGNENFPGHKHVSPGRLIDGGQCRECRKWFRLKEALAEWRRESLPFAILLAAMAF